ncbi:MAG: heavy metal translocating P-type ATPase [Chloroflexota bacterium]
MKPIRQKYRLKNLDCTQCASNIEAGLKKMPEVQYASVSYATETLHLETTSVAAVLKRVLEIEPDVQVIDDNAEDHAHDEIEDSLVPELLKIVIAISLFVVGLVNVANWHGTVLEIWEYVVFVSAYLLTGWNVLETALRNILRKNWFDENFLMSVATLGAIAIHELPEAVGVMLFYKIGELLQDYAVNRSRRSVRALLELKVDEAHVREAQGLLDVSVESIAVGAIIVVRPGERIPLDGKVIEGQSQVDNSSLSGESIPVVINPGDEVFAGTVNLIGLLEIEVMRAYDQSAVAKLLDLVENASSRKAQTEKFITKFANYYSPIIVAIAAGIAFLPPIFIPGASLAEWTYRALVLLVISCPCALVISIPLGYFGGVGGASKMGILVKGANYLDVLAKVKTVVFDKTGTLTKGVFKVTEIVPLNGYDTNELLRIANIVESQSNHPIAQSIHEKYGNEGDDYELEEFKEIPGYGVEGKYQDLQIVAGNDGMLHKKDIEHAECEVDGTAVHIAVNHKYAGYIVVSDEIKDDAANIVSSLHAIGVKEVVLLTGDREKIAKQFATKLNIDKYYAQLLPENKVNIIEELMADDLKRNIAFVGDGINDAPSIARADVGIAMGELGSDAAIESADVVLMGDAPSKIITAISHARRTRSIVWQNIGFAFVVKAAFIGLGVFGLASMWSAVFADVGVALLAVLNATRVLK